MSTIPPVGSVPDVVTNTLIASDWGNAIGSASRGRVVQRFNTTAERDAAITTPVTGMLCYVVATNLFYGYRNPGGWTMLIGGPRDTHHAVVARNAAMTIGTTQAVVPFDTVQFDPAGLWSPAQSGFVIQAAGIYRLNASLSIDAAAAAYMNIIPTINGAGLAVLLFATVATQAITAALSPSAKCAPGDLVQVQAYVTGTASPSNRGKAYNYFGIDYLGTG